MRCCEISVVMVMMEMVEMMVLPVLSGGSVALKSLKAAARAEDEGEDAAEVGEVGPVAQPLGQVGHQLGEVLRLLSPRRAKYPKLSLTHWKSPQEMSVAAEMMTRMANFLARLAVLMAVRVFVILYKRKSANSNLLSQVLSV